MMGVCSHIFAHLLCKCSSYLCDVSASKIKWALRWLCPNPKPKGMRVEKNKIKSRALEWKGFAPLFLCCPFCSSPREGEFRQSLSFLNMCPDMRCDSYNAKMSTDLMIESLAFDLMWPCFFFIDILDRCKQKLLSVKIKYQLGVFTWRTADYQSCSVSNKV